MYLEDGKAVLRYLKKIPDKELYTARKVDAWGVMLRCRMKPVHWGKATEEGTYVEWEWIPSQEQWKIARAELFRHISGLSERLKMVLGYHKCMYMLELQERESVKSPRPKSEGSGT